MLVIEAQAISKTYPERQGPRVLFGRGGIQDWFRGGSKAGFTALKNVSLAVRQGESLGIIGGNGSGKSTLLKILAGVTLPTTGEVEVRGRVASLLELGAGFHPMLTGRENIYLNAGIYGLRRAEVDTMMEDIVEFSGIREFIDRPVDTYSSGMYVRIAFSVAIHMNPDIFLVDEVLAVGDEEFQRKCRRKLGELREAGKTILFVSHDLGIVNTVCDRVVLLSHGELLERGTPQQTFDYYLRQIGHAGGIHRLVRNEQETLFSNGRISLFKQAEELTAADGIYGVLQSMGQFHLSTTADWLLLESSGEHFVAEGVMPRVPARLRFDARTTTRGLSLSLSLTAEHAFSIDTFSLVLALPATVDRWSFDGQVLEAREITPAHVHDEAAAMPDSESHTIVAFASNSANDLALGCDYAPLPGAHLQLMNGDYLSGTRRLYWNWRPSPEERMVAAGTTLQLGPLELNLELDATAARAAVKAQEALQCVEAGGVVAHLRQGRVVLETSDGKALGEVHGLICSHDLWNNTTFLQSAPAHRHGETVHMVTRSSRLPFTLEWELCASTEGVSIALWLSCEKEVSVQEFNLSLLLPATYTDWNTGHEQGGFPPFIDTQDWQPVNMSYQLSQLAKLSGDAVPAIAWHSKLENPAARASILNTGAAMHQRVAQWMCRPNGADSFRFGAGRHPLVQTVLTLETE